MSLLDLTEERSIDLTPDAAPDEDENTDWRGRDNSRDWLRLAGALAVVVLLVIAIIVILVRLIQGRRPV